MQGNTLDSNPEEGILSKIQEGMKVYDPEGKEIGRIKDIRFGEVHEDMEDVGRGPQTVSSGTLDDREPGVDDFAFGGAGYTERANETDLIRSRMLRLGYIRIDTGVFGSDRIALPEQIESVTQDAVNLRAKKDDLPRPA